MKKKKILIIALVLVIVASATGGGVYAYGQYKDKKTEVDVYPFDDLVEEGMEEDGLTSYGIVTNDLQQNIKYDKDKEIVKIYVKKGDKVKVGDPLVEYNMKSSNEDIEIKKEEIQNIQNSITVAQKQLTTLQNTKPVAEISDSDTVANEPQIPDETDDLTDTEIPAQVPEKEGDAYNIISLSAKSYDEDSDGSSENPYRFLCTQKAYVLGEYLNFLREKGYSAVFEVRKGNKVNGALITSWTVNGKTLEKVEDDIEFSVSTKEEIDRKQEEEEQRRQEEEEQRQQQEEEAREAAEAAQEAAEAAQQNQITYTASELASAILEKEKELKDTELNLKRAQLELKQMEKEAESNIVKATISGVVKKVQDINNLNQNKSVVSVMGSEGLYVTGSISELLLDQVKVGQSINAMNYETQTPLKAKITEISQYPTTGADMDYYGGSGNPNCSYYPFTAYIEDASHVHNGDQVELKIDTKQETDSDAMYLIKSMVRKENGKYYVMKRGKDKRLVKQYIQVGKTMYGYSIEIKSGIKSGDFIAFPYGKNVKEGVRTKEASAESLYN